MTTISQRLQGRSPNKPDKQFWHWFVFGIIFIIFLLYCLNYLQENQDKFLRHKTEIKTDSLAKDSVKAFIFTDPQGKRHILYVINK